jgi:hypothetical protein
MVPRPNQPIKALIVQRFGLENADAELKVPRSGKPKRT